MEEELKKQQSMAEAETEMLTKLLDEASKNGKGEIGKLKDLMVDKNIIKKETPKKDVLFEDDEDDINDDDVDYSPTYDYDEPYDLVPLPSRGLVYKNIPEKIPVSYLTASDEDLITSPNLYIDGKIMDLLLSRKIMDKRIKPENLIDEDREAIIIWLRSTSYGSNFPVKVTDPVTGEVFDSEVDLSTLKYKEFNLTPDENGLFDFILPNEDEIKFKFLTNKHKTKYAKSLEKTNLVIKKHYLNSTYETVKDILDSEKNMASALKGSISNLLENIKTWIDSLGEAQDSYYSTSVTFLLKNSIVSVNGNTDKKYINKYVDYMRAGHSKVLRDYILNNTPGVDMNVSVKRPESLGGGSINTFLELSDSIFINIA